MSLWIFMLGFVLFAQSNANGIREFPSSIERCTADDKECIATAITNLMARSADGIPEFNVPSLDPLKFGNGLMSQPSSGPISMNMTMSDGQIFGWSKMRVTKVIGFDKDPKKSKFEIRVVVPYEQITGKYTMVGKALLMPLMASGACNMTFDDVGMVFKFKTKVIERDGEEYLQLKKIDTLISTKKMYAHFDNIFSNKAISDNANMLMNEYQDALFKEIRYAFGVSRSGMLERILMPAFEMYPYRTWFKE